MSKDKNYFKSIYELYYNKFFNVQNIKIYIHIILTRFNFFS